MATCVRRKFGRLSSASHAADEWREWRKMLMRNLSVHRHIARIQNRNFHLLRKRKMRRLTEGGWRSVLCKRFIHGKQHPMQEERLLMKAKFFCSLEMFRAVLEETSKHVLEPCWHAGE